MWHDFCDWYVEIVKPRLASDEDAKGVLYHVLRDIVKLLHPIVPFITEEIWQVLGEAPESICRAGYPEAGATDADAESQMAALQEIVTGVRAIRADLNVPAKAKPSAAVSVSSQALIDALQANEAAIQAMTNTGEWSFGLDVDPAPGSARKVLACGQLFVDVADMIDIEAEKARLQGELKQVEKDLAQATGKLSNENFLKRAPEDVVAKERSKQAEFAQKKERLEANLASLGA